MGEMDAIKMALLGEMLSGAKDTAEKHAETQRKRAALLPSFETEEEALEYAQRVAALRPGDMVKIFNDDDTGFQPAVFVGFDMSTPPSAIVLRYDDDKQLCTVAAAVHAIVVD